MYLHVCVHVSVCVCVCVCVRVSVVCETSSRWQRGGHEVAGGDSEFAQSSKTVAFLLTGGIVRAKGTFVANWQLAAGRRCQVFGSVSTPRPSQPSPFSTSWPSTRRHHYTTIPPKVCSDSTTSGSGYSVRLTLSHLHKNHFYGHST